VFASSRLEGVRSASSLRGHHENLDGLLVPTEVQVEHLHNLGVTTHTLVVENTELTEAIHDHFMKKSAS
jgi:hypothetical protein